jgi:hypothetical protein
MLRSRQGGALGGSFSPTNGLPAMDETKQLKKRLDFQAYPRDWRVLTVAVDWVGEAMVLFEEGKPQQPGNDDGKAIIAWMNHPAKAHHLIHWDNGRWVQTRFDNDTRSIFTSHIQPFGEGWLLADSRGGLARVFDSGGKKVVRTLDLGDASEHIQTTQDGHIWVGYFDEGVFGGSIGSNGLVCFDPDGNAVFKYADFAEANALPYIHDCYALNVFEDTVWICYYSSFPLVCLKNFQFVRAWPDFGNTKAFAVRKGQLLRFPAYRKRYLTVRHVDDERETIWKLADSDGKLLSEPLEEKDDDPTTYRAPFSVAARGPKMYIYTEKALFELL